VKHGSQTEACHGKYITAELLIQSKSTEDALAIYVCHTPYFTETSIICAPDFQIVFGKISLLPVHFGLGHGPISLPKRSNFALLQIRNCLRRNGG
jgi:hypothetical protein